MTTTETPATDAPAGSCCVEPAAAGVDAARAQELARVFKALGEPARVRLLSIVAAQQGHEACVCDLTEPVGLSQPTVSHHLKVLVDAGLLTRSQRGRWAYYAVAPGALDRTAAALGSL
ncbi:MULTISPECIES: helix-turn-helix transcriptional regulator [Isoptericola]|uniref:Helix-turn-helix transcriptional regulator n=1 Tax=Isoptericola sediminis TaxID=2733572 RepID=A0A849KDJ0_9MICO|nr:MULTISPECIES: metalloregulator ArsR/SmtB family transcription factor [Isoptericola]MDO8143569.1 metalloregulator ArsR/SmtB family transcription factor [Isoptericola sp. 178]MDO8147435.1 metalloregulator ArsR/SmtB family transcription factor [Isoptericola sp. b515]MDO8150256.1 metalloregulator ArsR/SmtB family transcription factor [Isoptericola sp. b408]NNU26643.1 helix-turn-helix transcriptional regulator [Isoptericola sediminis]